MGRPRVYDDGLREALLSATRAELVFAGVAEVSLRNVCQLCGTSTNAVYTLFGSNESLVLEVVHAVLMERLEHWESLVAGVAPRDGLRLLAEDLAAWAEAQPSLFDACFSFPVSVSRGGRRARLRFPVVSGDEVLGGFFMDLVPPAFPDVPSGEASQRGVWLWAFVRGLVETSRCSGFPAVDVGALSAALDLVGASRLGAFA